MKNWKTALLALSAAVLLLVGAGAASADPIDITTSFDCVGVACAQSTQHDDQDPWKGLLTVSATNNTSVPWGDFHFELFQVTDPIDNVFFQVENPYQPQSSQSITWSPSVDGSQTLDIFFYGDPVNIGDTLNISVYTNNVQDKIIFGVSFYPTPIPEPGTAALVGFALLGLLALARRRVRH